LALGINSIGVMSLIIPPSNSNLRRVALDEREERFPMARMRDSRSSAKARAGREREACRLRDLGEREGVELRRHLAQEPGAIALLGILSCSLPVAGMALRESDHNQPQAARGASKSGTVLIAESEPYLSRSVCFSAVAISQ